MPRTSWTYHNPVTITFGRGRTSGLPRLLSGRKAALITTPGSTRRGVVDSLKSVLGTSLTDVFDRVEGYPTFASIREAYRSVISKTHEVIIALGGGSVIDTAKALAATSGAGDENWLFDHLHGGRGFPESFLPKPVIAIPTTAGTGSEVTMWATIWDFQEKKKYSVSHPLLYPERAVLDTELTATLPEKETIHGGLDALSHAMEAIWNKNHNPVSDTFALKAIELVIDRLPLLKSDLRDLDLRTDLLQASLFAGLAFSNTKTALAHSISYPLTAHFGLAHGLACALPLPLLIEFNGSHSPDRVMMMAKSLSADRTLESMQEKTRQFFGATGVSTSLRDYGVEACEAELIAGSAYTAERADNNIRPVEGADLRTLISKLF